jgi:NADPH:quinone reductase-like Zn-dependent oxidoreductase
MRAFGLADEKGSAGVIEVPTPEPGPGEVRIRVGASSVNGFDAVVASGSARQFMEHRYPVVVGKDLAGVADAVGEGVTSVSVGDEVVGITPPSMVLSSVGSYAEHVVVPAEGFLAPRPANLDLGRAASVGLAAATAFVAVEAVAPSDGDVVLVVGATGGVGAYAVQLAAHRGATVVATALPEDEAWIRGLGASAIVDYSGDIVPVVRERYPAGVDAAIVAVNLGEAFAPTARLVRDGGRLASALGGADAEAIAARGVAGTNVVGQSDPEAFRTVLRLAGEGRLEIPITRTYGFDDLPEALGLVGERRSRGKFAVMISG